MNSLLVAGFVLLLGLSHDVLSAIYIKAVAKDKNVIAAAISGLLTGMGYLAWLVMARYAFDGIAGVTIYAVGGSLGTLWALKKKGA